MIDQIKGIKEGRTERVLRLFSQQKRKNFKTDRKGI